MKTRCVLAALLWMAGRGFAVEEVPYAIAKEPWAEGLGNHRAVVRVEQKADAVVARIPWRRRDRDPERELPRRKPAVAARIFVLHFDGFVLFPLALKR